MHRSRVALACMAVVVMMALLIPLIGCGGGGPTVPCRISSVSGDVQVLGNSSTNSVNATDGMELVVGDTITTGSDGSANLTFFDGSLMEIKANSEILVKELSTASTGSTSVSLRQNIGRTINRVNKLIDSASKYEVETRSASTVVKGTIFELLVLQNGNTTVKAEEGSVSFTASGVTVTVNQGFQSNASVGGIPSTPSAMATTTPTPTAIATVAETPASIPTISSTPTSAVTPAKTPVYTPTPTSTQPTPNGAMPQELIGVWKSDCGVHVGNQSRTIVWTLKGSTLQMVYDLWNSDSSCSDPSKKFEDFVMTWESDLVTQNTNGSYQVTATLIAETATELTPDWVAWANNINFYEYNDWQVGVSKDVLGRLREPGASSPELNKGTQSDFLLTVDGDKLSIDSPGLTWLNDVIFTKQSAMPQELIGVWKSDCVAGTEQNQYLTYNMTVTDTSIQVIQEDFLSDSSCTDPSIYMRFVSAGETDQVSQNADGSYEITYTYTQMWATALKQEYISSYNSNNLWGYSDWQVGVSKDCIGRTALPGYPPVPTKDSQLKLFMKVDGDKLTVNDLGVIIEYTRQ